MGSRAVIELACKPDFEQAQGAWDALWNHAILDRPCTMVTARKVPEAVNYPRIIGVDDDFAEALQAGSDFLDTHEFLGEAMPAFRPGFGPDQMAAFLGAPLEISEGSHQTSWSVKIVNDWEAFLPLCMDESNRYFQRMKAYHEAAEAHFAGQCLLSDIDMHSNIDLLEGLRGAQDLLFDMIDTPEVVLTAMAQARNIYRQVYETFHGYGDKSNLGTTCGLPMYDRGRFNRIQADFIALLNPALFREIVLPELAAEADYLDRSCFHLDGPDALTHLDDILAIESLDAIQWVSGAGNRPQIEWPDVLHRIQKAGKIIILHLSAADVRRIHGTYNPELLVYDVKTDSVEEGLQLLNWLSTHT